MSGIGNTFSATVFEIVTNWYFIWLFGSWGFQKCKNFGSQLHGCWDSVWIQDGCHFRGKIHDTIVLSRYEIIEKIKSIISFILYGKGFLLNKNFDTIVYIGYATFVYKITKMAKSEGSSKYFFTFKNSNSSTKVYLSFEPLNSLAFQQTKPQWWKQKM